MGMHTGIPKKNRTCDAIFTFIHGILFSCFCRLDVSVVSISVCLAAWTTNKGGRSENSAKRHGGSFHANFHDHSHFMAQWHPSLAVAFPFTYYRNFISRYAAGWNNCRQIVSPVSRSVTTGRVEKYHVDFHANVCNTYAGSAHRHGRNLCEK